MELASESEVLKDSKIQRFKDYKYVAVIPAGPESDGKSNISLEDLECHCERNEIERSNHYAFIFS